MILWKLLENYWYAWPAVMTADMVTSFVWTERIRRGVIYRFWQKHLGLFGNSKVEFGLAAFGLGAYYASRQHIFLSLFWLYITIAMVVNVITGAEKPPWHRAKAALNKLLEKIKPVPEPAINLS